MPDMNEAEIQFFDGQPAVTTPAPSTPQRAEISLLSNPFVSLPAANTGSLAVEASRAIADMQMARLMAKKFPRDRRAAMDQILVACTSKDLAEIATFSYVRGDTEVNQPSIRLAEAVAQAWGNLRSSVEEISREGMWSTVRTYAIDLETGFEDEKKFQVKHWRDTKKGGYQLKDERDIYELVANMGARRKRACIQAVIPREVFNLAVQQCDITLHATASTDTETVAKMLAKFERFGVTQEHIEAKIQRHIDAITPAHMVLLRKVYNGISDGMAKPSSYFDMGPDEESNEKGGATLRDLVARSGVVNVAATPEAVDMTFDEVRAAITKAIDADALDATETLIPHIEREDERRAAAELLAVKRESLNPPEKV